MRNEPDQHCPFCNATISPRARSCPYCKASRYGRQRMTPAGFNAFFAIWTSTTLLIALVSLYIAFVPWLPYGETPGYALAVVGAKPTAGAPQQGGCTIEVLDAYGRTSKVVTAGSCHEVDASKVAAGTVTPKRPTPVPAASPGVLIAANSLHTLLTLGIGTLLSVLWLRALRRYFQRSGQPGWVRHAAF